MDKKATFYPIFAQEFMIKKIIISLLIFFQVVQGQHANEENFTREMFGYLGIGADYQDANIGIVQAFQEFIYDEGLPKNSRYPLIKPFVQAGFGEDLKYDIRYDAGVYLKYFSSNLEGATLSSIISTDNYVYYYNRGIQINVVKSIDEKKELKVGIGLDYSFASIHPQGDFFSDLYYEDYRFLICPQIQWEPLKSDKWISFFLMGNLPTKASNLTTLNERLNVTSSPNRFYDWSVTFGIKITKFEASID